MRLDTPIVGVWTRIDSNLIQQDRRLRLGAALCRQLLASWLPGLAASSLALSHSFGLSFWLCLGFRLLG